MSPSTTAPKRTPRSRKLKIKLKMTRTKRRRSQSPSGGILRRGISPLLNHYLLQSGNKTRMTAKMKRPKRPKLLNPKWIKRP